MHVVGVRRFELLTSSVSGKRSPPELNARSCAAMERRRGNKRARFLWPQVCHGAGYGVRTRDLHLGKVASYQLRQARDARRYNTGPSQPAQAPISTFFSVEKNVQVVAVNKLRFTPIEHLRRRRGCRLGNAMRIAPLPQRPSRQGLCGWRERHPWVGRGGIRRATRT